MKRVLAALTCVVLGVLLPAGPARAAPGPADAQEYWFDDWNLFDLWDSGVRGQGVTIAEIDTGVNADLIELTGRVLSGTDLGRSGNGQVDRELDEFGHGTAMASIMVARPGLLGITGMAPDAKVLPIAVPLNGTTDSTAPDRLPDAIRYAADHGANVISMSLGGKRFANSDSASCPDDEQAAIFHAIRMGALVVASVGNTGPKRNVVEEPGVCLGVLSVGAITQSGTVAGFSTRQPYLSLVAPGVNIPSLGRVPGNAYSGDGTSQATAIVSAAAALVWSKYPKLTARQVSARIFATLDDKQKTHSSAYGYGAINAYRAVTAAVSPTAANPVYDAVAPFLTRAGAFEQRAKPKPPAPAAKAVGRTGQYNVGSAPRFTPQVKTGLGLAAAGLLVLVMLLAFGLRRHRARAAATPLVPAPAWPTGPPPARERPRPSPRPADDRLG